MIQFDQFFFSEWVGQKPPTRFKIPTQLCGDYSLYCNSYYKVHPYIKQPVENREIWFRSPEAWCRRYDARPRPQSAPGTRPRVAEVARDQYVPVTFGAYGTSWFFKLEPYMASIYIYNVIFYFM